MAAPAEHPEPDRNPRLGSAVAAGLAAIFLMVGLGVFWVWHRAKREEEWRQRVNAMEPIAPREAR